MKDFLGNELSIGDQVIDMVVPRLALVTDIFNNSVGLDNKKTYTRMPHYVVKVERTGLHATVRKGENILRIKEI